MNTNNLYELKNIAKKLRGKNGCPWDQKQTHESLKKYLIEECYEVIDAIESGDDDMLKEELGDVLYQIYAHTEIAEESGRFTIEDVAQGIINKLVMRHPHVFGDENIETADKVADRWESIKLKEKKLTNKSLLDGVPSHLPALLKAYRVQEKVSRVGFDWDNIEGPINKIEEELEEFKTAHASENHEHIEEEFGDLLFTLVNVARFLKIDPEEALQKANKKFMKRFCAVEKEVHSRDQDMNNMSLEELDAVWEKVKSNGL